jgi:hypothetical protein
MTREDALQIREWRVKGCTWRRVADCAAEKWPAMGYEAGNQEQGRHLCELAAATLGEDCRDEFWN